MSDQENLLENATIKFDGSARGPNETGIEMFIVATDDGYFWFELEYEFETSGNDFWAIVRNFGLRRKTSAGAADPSLRRTFTQAEAKTAQSRLTALFLGPKENPALPYFPFQLNRPTRCLGVKFPMGWIRTA